MNTYYISLVQLFIGKCIKIDAPTATDARKWAYKNLGRIWCDVYQEQGNMEIIGETRISEQA